MKRTICLILALALLTFAPAGLGEADSAATATSFLEMLSEGAYEDAFALSDAVMQGAVGSAQGYASIWDQLSMYGEYSGSLVTGVQDAGDYTAVTIDSDFTGVVLSLLVALDADGLVGGFQVVGLQIKETVFDAEHVETWPLREGAVDETEALFTMPAGDGPYPAVVLLHGSGPADRDETAYGVKVFEELANGLAENGVASLRYAKYTFAHADQLTGDRATYFTVEDEYLYDLTAAIALLEADERVSAIYLVGHSEGAMLAPRLAASLESEKLCGMALLCGTPLHLWQIQYDQNLAIVARLPEADAANLNAQLDAELAKLDTFADMSDEQLAAATFFGLPAYYQWDEMSVDGAATVIENGLPILIVQGGKDWQVTPEAGIDAWREALDGWDGATYLEYPDMNHLLCEQPGEVVGSDADYAELTGVSEALIGDLAEWILAN